jgi:hypothetical protein
VTINGGQIDHEPDGSWRIVVAADPGVPNWVLTAGRTSGLDAGLSPTGVATNFEMLVQTLANRLRVEELIATHPEIERIPVVRPIVICGLPRTGTTYLHNSLAADPALRHLPYWESLEPVPVPVPVPVPARRPVPMGRIPAGPAVPSGWI